MRNEKRIPIIIDFFKKNPEVLNKFLGTDGNTEEIIILLEQFWKDYPDQRLGQLLINHEVISNGFIWNIEEVDWLIENNYFKFEELNFWGVNYNKEGKKLPKTKFKLLKDLDLEHIKAIKEYFKEKNLYINLKYTEYFDKRIKENK